MPRREVHPAPKMMFSGHHHAPAVFKLSLKLILTLVCHSSKVVTKPYKVQTLKPAWKRRWKHFLHGLALS